MGPCRNLLGNHIRLSKGEIQHPAHVPDSAPGSHGAEGDDLSHPVGAVLSVDIVNDLSPSLLAEVRIKIGHTHPFGIQEPFEDQVILHGVHFRDVDAVGHNGACAGATAWAYRNPNGLGIVDKVPDDEIVVHIAHRADDADLILHPLPVLLGFVRIPLPESLFAEFAEVFFVCAAPRHRVGRQMVLVEGKIHIAHLGDLHRIVKGLRAVGEQLPELLFTF